MRARCNQSKHKPEYSLVKEILGDAADRHEGDDGYRGEAPSLGGRPLDRAPCVMRQYQTASEESDESDHAHFRQEPNIGGVNAEGSFPGTLQHFDIGTDAGPEQGAVLPQL